MQHQPILSDGETIHVVIFRLCDEEFALDVSRVQEIIRFGEITWVPKCPKFIKGVINLRGNLIPVAHLGERLGFGKIEYGRQNRIIVVELDDITIGFIVDLVLEARELPLARVQPPPTIVLGGVETEYITGVAKLEDRLVILLDIEKILSMAKKEVEAD